jgi:glycosyltransferase involved in cell wall biosynthesis
MTIGFDAKRLYCNNTGLGNYSRTLVENLVDFYPKNLYHLYTPKLNVNEKTAKFISNPNLKTFVPKAFSKSLWRSFLINQQLQNDNIELYHGLSNEIPFSLSKTKIKSVVTIHDLIFKIYPETYGNFERKIYDIKFKYACKNADKIIAISESTKNDIIKLYEVNEEKIEVIYQTINPIFFEENNKDNLKSQLKNYDLPQEFLLYVGSVEPRKNLKNIIKAYDFLSNSNKIPLVIIGRGGAYKNEMMELIKSSNLSTYFLWLNIESNQHLKAIYSKATALVYPSYYEGFGIPILEAIMSNVPVISSNNSSLMEAGGPNSIYIDAAKPTEIADAIDLVLSNSSLREKMIAKGQEYAQKAFNPQVLTNQLVNCYNNLF